MYAALVALIGLGAYIYTTTYPDRLAYENGDLRLHSAANADLNDFQVSSIANSKKDLTQQQLFVSSKGLPRVHILKVMGTHKYEIRIDFSDDKREKTIELVAFDDNPGPDLLKVITLGKQSIEGSSVTRDYNLDGALNDGWRYTEKQMVAYIGGNWQRPTTGPDGEYFIVDGEKVSMEQYLKEHDKLIPAIF